MFMTPALFIRLARNQKVTSTTGNFGLQGRSNHLPSRPPTYTPRLLKSKARANGRVHLGALVLSLTPRSQRATAKLLRAMTVNGYSHRNIADAFAFLSYDFIRASHSCQPLHQWAMEDALHQLRLGLLF